ncbi:MAG: MFS transporter [Promethearchaeota archaeon]
MSETTTTIQKVSTGTRIAFAIGEVGDNTALNIFNFLIFTFYFTVVKLPVLWITIGFMIWSFWNAFNDPITGWLSDKTKTRWGRRVPWMAGATIPLGILMILLFTPPLAANSDVLNFVYFLIVLILFDTIYTAFNLNYNALFSEMFVEMRDRSSTGKIRISFVMLGTIFAYLFPSFIIEDITNRYNRPETLTQFQIVGLIAAIIIFVAYFIILKWGCKEPKVFSKDAETAMGFFTTFKKNLQNKAFLWFLFPALGTWIVIGILPTLAPLHMTYAIGIDDADLIGIILMIMFLMSAASTPLWEKIRVKWGARMSGLVGIIFWLIPIVIFAFSTSDEMAFIVAFFEGVGLGGGLYFYDQCIAEIIDEDEITYGTRRSGAYYAVINFLIRLSSVVNFLIIGLVFSSADWQTYVPNPGVNTILALRILMGIYPAIVLIISAIGMYFYPIHGERLIENRRKLTELHAEKQKKLELA